MPKGDGTSFRLCDAERDVICLASQMLSCQHICKREMRVGIFWIEFYGLPVNELTVTLAREEWTVPQRLRFGDHELIPLRAGEKLPWKLL